MKNMRYKNLLEKTVDFSDFKEYNCKNRNGVYFYTNVIWVREYPNGGRVEIPQPDFRSLVEPRLY